jgi:AmmeMemoRadiSam system protein A
VAIAAQDRGRLIQLARRAVEATITRSPLPQPQPLAGVLAEKRGCFVTLTNAGRLRGCIGTFQPQRPLGETVVQMGQAAARDGRFVYDPIVPSELAELEVEVSVLSPLAPTDDPLSLQIGTHGIYIVRGGWAGCFLPEVAAEQGWDAQQFLSHCCSGKAGLPADAWKQPGTQVYLFTSEKFAS